jgi:hypothetical protein
LPQRGRLSFARNNHVSAEPEDESDREPWRRGAHAPRRSRREWSRWESSDIDEAREGERAGERINRSRSSRTFEKSLRGAKLRRTFPAGIRPAGAEADRRESARALMSGVANQSMEPMGIERHRRSPQGERTGASEWSPRDTVRHRRSKAEVADRELGSSSQSIEVQAHARSKRVSDAQSLEERSRREWSRWESSDIDEARKGEPAGASESIEAQAHVLSP